jgi:hypothetical protein
VKGTERVVRVVEGPHGTKAVLRVAASTDGGRCWRIAYTGGAGGGGCPPKDGARPDLDAALWSAGADTFVEAEVVPAVASVELRFPGATTRALEPVEGFVIAPLTDAEAAGSHVVVVAFDRTGREVARRRLALPRGG